MIKTKNIKYILAVMGLCILTLAGCGKHSASEEPGDGMNADIDAGNGAEGSQSKKYAGTFYTFDKEELLLDERFDISECYITNEVTTMNHYYIDENNVLWGNGQNDCGQLGIDRPGDIGNLDAYYEEYVKIAENVVHVDCPLNGRFMIYLTEDGKLYGTGMNTTGFILMENVKYARAGNANIIALLENGDVYWWGEHAQDGSLMVYEEPLLLLKDARYVTCEDETAAAISQNNELYTWGNNEWGQCGIITEEEYIQEPVKVLADVRMVWIHFLKFNCPKGQGQSPEETYKYQYYWNTFVLLENGEFAAAGRDIGQYEVLEEVFEEFEDPGKKEIIYYSPEFLYIDIKEGDE